MSFFLYYNIVKTKLDKKNEEKIDANFTINFF